MTATKQLAFCQIAVPQMDDDPPKLVFSPMSPNHVGVMYTNYRPRIFDLKRTPIAQAAREYETGNGRVPVIKLDERSEIKLPIMCPATAIAFRPTMTSGAVIRKDDEGNPLEEIAFCFGEGDFEVHRVNLNTVHELPGISAQEPSAIAYSRDGDFVAVGGCNGDILTYRLADTSKKPLRESLSTLSGAITQLAFSPESKCVFAATNYNKIGCVMRTRQAARHLALRNHDENRQVVGVKWQSLAVHSSKPLLAFCGTSSEFWLANVETNKIIIIDAGLGDILHHIEFTSQDEIILVGENGIQKWRYILSPDGDPCDAERICLIEGTNDAPGGPFLSGKQYGNLFCIARLGC
jgi:WD40 repeat protein